MTSPRFCKRILPWRAGILAIVLFGAVPVGSAAETFVQTEIDSSGQLRILTRKHREIVPKKDADQLSFAKAEISPDGRAVGWLAMYPSCCSTDPIPLKLVVYTADNVRTFTGTGLPVWRWCFEAEGKQVAFRQETIQGGTGLHYELRDVATGDLVAKYEPDDAEIIAKPPRWVADVNSR